VPISRFWHRLSPLLGLLLFVVALWVLGREIRQMSVAGLAAAVRAMPSAALWLAALFTTLNYAILTGYDQLAFVYIRRSMPKWQVTMASFVGYAIANNVGFALLSGTSARYRFYSRWGLSGADISRVVIFYSGTFWLGLVVLGAWSLLFSPVTDAESLAPGWLTGIVGVGLVAAAGAYALSPLFWRRPITLGRTEIPLPSPLLITSQFVLSALDWSLGAAVLYVLLPEPRPDFAFFLGAFLTAQIVALVSHVPGGIGVFESLMILLLKPWMTADALLPALAAYRLIYYLLPLAAALAVLVVDEMHQRRHQVVRWGNAFGALTTSVAPKLLAVFTLLAGALLMLTVAAPHHAEQAQQARAPLALVEVSHVAASLAGFGLLVVSWGLARRLAGAYALALGGLAAGVAATLVRAGAGEQALLLSALAVAFVPLREEFDRRAPLFGVPLSHAWLSAVAAVVLATTALGFFTHRRTDLAWPLLWQFGPDAEAGRFLRSTAAVLVAALALGVRRLASPPGPDAAGPLEPDLEAATRVIERQPFTWPYLVFLRDKTVVWDPDRTAFLMYARQDDTFVALGDPVGPADRGERLVKRFLEEVDDRLGVPVFYEASRQWLPCYADFGLTFVKLGEEARVHLPRFVLGAPKFAPLDAALATMEQGGGRFDIIEPDALTPDVMAELRRVSGDWLATTGGPEKGFSLGFFDEQYVQRLAVAVIWRGNRLEAFATVWRGASRVELSADLLRWHGSAAASTPDALLTALMQWGRAQGYEWFSLGMAPLASFEHPSRSRLWSRLGRAIYGRGDAFYHARDVRTFKERFDPVWEPRYLAYPGGVPLPQVLGEVSALIAGGYRRPSFRD
jgi:phosphatidylglycerol lysyltransferase